MASKRPQADRRIWHDILLMSVFGLYVAILLLFLFGKSNYMRAVNFVPFFTIKGYLFRHMPMAVSNLAGNILLFVPMGVYLPLFSRRGRTWSALLWILLMSIAVEAAQFFLRAGSADIDDVILNVTGGLIGILFYRLLRAAFGERSRFAVEIIALTAGIAFAAGAVCLWTGAFGIRIKMF